MKKFLSLLTIALLAMPVFAQDDVVLTGGDIDALLGGGNRGNNNRGRGNNNQPQIPDPIFFFEDVKALLKNNKVPLDKNQEKALQTFLNSETTKMRTDLEAQFQSRGNRGNGNQQNDLTRIRDFSAAVEKHNTALLAEAKAALMPDQASLVDKAAKDKKVCSVLIDMINFDQLRQRFSGNNNNNNRGGGGFDGGFDLGALGLDFPQGGGGGNRGNNNNFQNQISGIIPSRPSCTSKDSTTAQRVAVLGDVLTKGKKPLTADQETKVAALVEGKLKTMMDELKATDPQIERFVNDLANQARNNNNQTQNQTQNQPAQTPQVNIQTLTNNIVNTIMQNLGIQNTNNNNNNNANRGGGRGNAANNNAANNNAANPANNANANAANAGRGNNNPQNFNPQAEIQKKSEELFDKVAAMLKPEQGTFVKKVKYDQIKARGPVDKYRGILEQEGTPLTPEQITQIQLLLNTTNQAVRTFAQGLVTTEIQALEPGALQAAAEQIIQQQNQQAQQNQNPQQNRGNNNNAVNNVSQNGVAQQIVSKLISQVSVQRARLDKIAADQIMTRVLTPAQQASYKVSQMN